MNVIEKYTEDLVTTCQMYNIIRERSEVYHDFLLSLVKLIDSTYMGDDVMSRDDRINHFWWCFNQVINNFEMESIHFTNKNHGVYIWDLLSHIYYPIRSTQLVIDYLKLIFDYRVIKTKEEIDSFVEIYRVFDHSLKKYY